MRDLPDTVHAYTRTTPFSSLGLIGLAFRKG